MKQGGLKGLLDFLSQLRARGIQYSLERQDPESLMVSFETERHFVEAYVDDAELWFSAFAKKASGEMTDETVNS